MTPLDWARLAGFGIFILGMIVIAIRLLWWAADMDQLFSLFGDYK